MESESTDRSGRHGHSLHSDSGRLSQQYGRNDDTSLRRTVLAAVDVADDFSGWNGRRFSQTRSSVSLLRIGICLYCLARNGLARSASHRSSLAMVGVWNCCWSHADLKPRILGKESIASRRLLGFPKMNANLPTAYSPITTRSVSGWMIHIPC